jgi:hypothetical protein
MVALFMQRRARAKGRRLDLRNLPKHSGRRKFGKLISIM